MFAQLPEQIKQEVLQQLLKDNFQQAKEIHDAWLRTRLNNNKEQA